MCPYAGPGGVEDEIAAIVLEACGGQRNGNRISFIAKDGLVVVVDLCADGRERFAHALNQIKGESASTRQEKEISEENLRAAMLPPGFVDPDLILIFGSPTQIPPSLMWELSYSELVFLDVSWRNAMSIMCRWQSMTFNAGIVDLAVLTREPISRQGCGVAHVQTWRG